jgi:hypothetical protein
LIKPGRKTWLAFRSKGYKLLYTSNIYAAGGRNVAAFPEAGIARATDFVTLQSARRRNLLQMVRP